MFNSKIIIAPIGYGEMAPRDLDAAQFGAILIKPDMSFVDTVPNMFEDKKTYISCKHDYSDLEEKIQDILENYDNYLYLIDNARKKFEDIMNPKHLALHLHKLFSNLNGVEYE